MQTSTQMVRSGNATLCTQAMGVPDRGTILLVMGATASMLWWPDALITTLAQAGYRVVRFDHRDTGHSSTNAPGDVQYDLGDLASDILAILDAYEVEAAHLVGMSLGGYVSQLVAIEHPHRVQTLTLFAAEPLGVQYPGEGISPRFMEHFATMADLDWHNDEDVANFLAGIARLSAGSRRPFDHDQAMRRIHRELARTQSMQSAFNHSAIDGGIDAAVTAASLSQPLLIIHGSDDPIIAVAAARKTAEIVPNSTLLVLDGVGHELLEEDVPTISQAILAHCRKLQQL